MAKTTTAPLAWPGGVPRASRVVRARSNVRLRHCIAEVVKAIDLLGDTTMLPAIDVIVSYNGSRIGAGDVDHGAAVWFVWRDAQRCVPCDLYDAHGANLLAIAQLIQGCAAEYARGSLAAIEQALAAYTPAVRVTPAAPERAAWSKVLGVGQDPSPSELTGAFRRRAHEVHPDKGGTREQWDGLVSAMAQAKSSMRAAEIPHHWDHNDSDNEREIWASLFPDPSADTKAD